MLLKYLKLTLRPTILQCISGVHSWMSVVRRATIEDKNEVLALNENGYDGLGYLPFYYESFLQNPIAIPFVISHEAQIIGYMCGFVVDGGETIVQRRAIISPKFEGKGYLQLLIQHTIQEARQRYNLQRMAFVINKDHPFIQRNSFWKKNTPIFTKVLN